MKYVGTRYVKFVNKASLWMKETDIMLCYSLYLRCKCYWLITKSDSYNRSYNLNIQVYSLWYIWIICGSRRCTFAVRSNLPESYNSSWIDLNDSCTLRSTMDSLTSGTNRIMNYRISVTNTKLMKIIFSALDYERFKVNEQIIGMKIKLFQRGGVDFYVILKLGTHWGLATQYKFLTQVS